MLSILHLKIMKFLTSTIFVLVVTFEESLEILQIPQDQLSFPVSECVLYILKKYFYKISKMSIRFQPYYSDVVTEIIKKIDLPININAEEIPKISGIEKRLSNQVCILMDESNNISAVLNKTLWIAQTQFIVIIPEESDGDKTLIFQQFWLHNVNNVIVLSQKNTDVHIHSFIPYNQFDCNVHKPILLATWSSGLLTNSSDFIGRPIINLNDCVLNITVVDLPPTIIFKNKLDRNGTNHIDGVEATLLNEISKKLKFTPRFAVPRDGQAWGWIQPTPAGIVGEVYKRTSQIGFGLLASTVERYEHLDTTVPDSCYKECITWAVPLGAGKISATWIAIIVTEFPITVWCLILAAGISTIIAFRVFFTFSITNRYFFRDTLSAIFYVFQSFLGIAYKAPKDRLTRILFASWLWYSFIIITVYQTSMGSKLTVPFRNPDINTFGELLQSDLHFTGFYNTFRLLLNADQEGDVKEIANRLEATDYGLAEAVEKIISDRNIAYMRESTTFMYNAMINPRAKGLVHIMQQCVYNYYPTMVLRKKDALTASINRIIRRLFETGFICKWRSKYLYDVPLPTPKVVKLSFSRMRGSFLLLCIGLGVALAIFCAEQLRYRLITRQPDVRSKGRILSEWILNYLSFPIHLKRGKNDSS